MDKFELQLNKCKRIIDTINSTNLESYREEIFQIINIWDNTKIQRDFTCRTTNTDLIINKEDKEIKLRDFIRHNYSTPPYFIDGKDFGYIKKQAGNLGGKHVEYPKKYVNNFGFWLCMFHEEAHVDNQEKENKNLEVFEHKSAVLQNEKIARTDGYGMSIKFKSLYGIDTVSEFKSIEEICAYANIHLLSYTNPESNIEELKQVLLQPKHFLPKM